ncbi:MAG: EamA family transporter [Bacteroidales bacterium]|nr:EamA family transporter [Bacteroidales bacterium]
MKQKTKSLIEIHLAVFLFGLAGLFGKLLSLPSTIIVLGRVLFASISLLLIIFYFKENLKLKNKNDYFYLALLGVILAIHWATFFKSIQVSTVAIGLLTFSTFPVFVTFLEPIFFKEKLKSRNILIAIITLIGVALVIPKFDISDNATLGVVWGVISGFTFAILSILNKKYVKNYSSLVIAFYQDATATIALLPFLLLTAVTFTTKDILLLILLGVIFTGVSHSLFIKGLANIKAHTASIIASLEPVYGIIFAIFIVNEVPTLRVILGGIIILGATFFVTISSHTEPAIPE